MTGTTMMMERTGMAMPGMTPNMGTTAPATGNMVMVPRCTMKVEKCAGRHEDHLRLRRQGRLHDDAEPVPDALRRHVQLAA